LVEPEWNVSRYSPNHLDQDQTYQLKLGRVSSWPNASSKQASVYKRK
jgi:hypothetical protein